MASRKTELPKDTAYKSISGLVKRFEEQILSYKKTAYNEAHAKQDFINPLFKALGWDVDNSQGYAEAYREVMYEDRIKVGNVLKAPDYSFKLPGGKRLFFVEAKKPSVFVKEEREPAYQVRSYAWSSKLPVSILTDFEEFAVYDCTIKPKETDKANIARISYITYNDYLKEFDFLWDTFSKEKVLKGSFDTFVQTNAAKKGTTTVDKAFLLSLDEWRKQLAMNIALRNCNIDEDELNFVVQQTIDRIIFLRIAEDRSLESYGRLGDSVKEGDFYKNLFNYFQQSDKKYNSGLFDFRKDQISKNIQVDNKIIKSIVSELYYPLSPYVFTVLNVEILGNAYEQFLGKQIKLTAGHRATIEEKPEVRKAGGVYYTPEYIVEYIVANTVHPLLKGKTPRQIEDIKIADISCGSGSFLLGAYQYLLNWHLDYYTHKASKAEKKKMLTPDGNLCTDIKKRILVNNIYGVDIDPQAVEVTKLSLLLKCMEGETPSSVSTQLSMFNERVLPTLDDNIKSGNSLIDADYYDGQLDFGEEKKIKPTIWIKVFPEVFKNGGFDTIIGNPPYGAAFTESELNYFKSNYKTSLWRGESYLLFVEKAITLLCHGGLLGFIMPDTLLNLGFTQSVRDFLLSNSKISQLVSLPSTVFSGAMVDTIIVITEKKEKTNTYHASEVLVKTFNKKAMVRTLQNPERSFKTSTTDWYQSKSFNVYTNQSDKYVIQKIEKGKSSINDIAEMFSGIKVYEVGKGKPRQTEAIRNSKPFTAETRKNKDWMPFYDGKHIGRYDLLWKNDNWINYGNWLAAPRDPENFKGEKILIRKITGKNLLATYVPDTSYCNTLLFVLKLKEGGYSYKSILAILNSDLIGWYYRKKFQINEDDTFPQIMIRDILQFPVPVIPQKANEELGKYVTALSQLNEERKSVKLQTQAEKIQQRIDHYEGKINQIVYQLYSLTKKEINVIEVNYTEDAGIAINGSITQSKAKVSKGTSMTKKRKIRKNSFSAITKDELLN